MGEEANNRIPRPISGWKPSTPAVDVSSFDQLLTENPAVAVHFWAEWDAHDQVLDRHIQAVIPKFTERVYFCSCNIDLEENRAFVKQGKFWNIPALLLFSKETKVRRIVGVRPPEELETELEKYLKGEPLTKKPWWRFWS